MSCSLGGAFVVNVHSRREHGCKTTDDWIETAVLDETNPSAANDVAKIAACLPAKKLNDRFHQSILTVPADDDSEWIRHLGLIEIARSCADRKSFETLLNFGLARRGDVLISTLDAITECAEQRMRSGDSDVVEQVLLKTDKACKDHHQKAAIAVFCQLVNADTVTLDITGRLWDFARDASRDEYSRSRSLESICLSKLSISETERDYLVELAKCEGDEIGWRAIEVLIRQNLITSPLPDWLSKRLGVEAEVHGTYDFISDDAITGWSAYLVGLLFRERPAEFTRAISSAISQFSPEAFYQIVGSLEFLGHRCPDEVCRAIINRITRSNNMSQADTEAIRVLRNISEKKLLTLTKAVVWRDWLPVGRASLCEMIGAVAVRNPALREEATTCLLEFAKDASFQVRRSAFRALSKADHQQLSNLCQSQTGDVEFRKRGAEACTWLPGDVYSDELIGQFGYSWDEEPSVRDVFKGTIQRRYRLKLANQYLDRVLKDCQKEDGVLLTYRYGHALESLGDDETADLIQNFLDDHAEVTRDETLEPHVRHYLRKVQKAIRKNWKDETKKWPEPDNWLLHAPTSRQSKLGHSCMD